MCESSGVPSAQPGEHDYHMHVLNELLSIKPDMARAHWRQFDWLITNGPHRRPPGQTSRHALRGKLAVTRERQGVRDASPVVSLSRRQDLAGQRSDANGCKYIPTLRPKNNPVFGNDSL